MQTIPFGTHVRDIITGQTGIVTGYCTYITGCDQYLLQPPAKAADNSPGEVRWVDYARLKPTGEEIAPEVAALANLDHAATSTPRGADIPAPRK